MSKWELQDIVPAERRQRVRRRPAQRRSTSKSRVSQEERLEHERQPSYDDGFVDLPIESSRGRMMRMLVLWGGIALLILIVGYIIATVFAGAELTVYPKSKNVVVQATFTAHQEPATGELGYTIMTLEKSGQETVSAAGEEEVEERARGTITVFNEYSQNSQRLIKNTRFESADGLVFRIEDSITVPGLTKDGDTVTPGKITVDVFADEPGDRYNIGAGRFTIPGLEGSDQFDSMYAVSETAMSGGFSGKRLTVDDESLQNTRQQVRNSLRDQLLNEAFAQKPEGFVLFEDAVFIDFTSLPHTSEGGGQAKINEKATLYGVLFEEAAFAGYLAQNTVAGFENDSVLLKDPSLLVFSAKDPDASPWRDATLEFNLNGSGDIVWTFDEELLRTDLSGISKEGLPTVLSGYPAIERAEAVIRPFWKRSFPQNPAEIMIEVKEAPE